METLSYSLPSLVSSQQTVTTCAPVGDVEWPPQMPLATEKQPSGSSTGTALTQTFDEIDPFADWPPRPKSNSSSGTTVKPPGSGMASNTSSQIDNWAFGKNSGERLSLHNNHNNSIGYQRQNQGNSSSTQTRAGDIGSIFSSNNKNGPSQAVAPRLAPPPLTAVGRGRGRGAQSSTRSTTTKSSSSQEQPSLLDLL